MMAKMHSMTGSIENQRIPEFDPGLLAESLRMSVEQRAARHQAALTLVLEMQRAGRELREPTESTAAKTVRS
jgi:hypothetical protein